jgi:DNA-binding NarL/FixJ family response regulator/tRNA A-37 threonylcarbamoyl transferase component Bud32
MIGQTLNNRYKALELIGEGATAAVYRGMDTRLQRIIAIKVLLPYVDETTRKRFQREALSAARLNHTNIMAIYDVSGDEKQPYLIIEYIEGRPLFSFIPSKPDVVIEFGRQICMALDYAHRQNLIHRDIKPANIHITPNGQVKIMDFGLAITGETKRLTATGRIIGTPAYLSPEQAQGLKLTHHTDIYSTGVVLYELVTGVLPFDADDIGVLLLQQVKKDPKPPSDIMPDIPLSLERAILKSLAKKPSERFETAGAMAAALAGSGQPREATVDAVAVPASDEEPAAAPESEAAPAPTQTSDVIRVALADDHRILRASLALYLDDTPNIAVIGEADDGAQALDIVREKHPDVLLLDLNMPGTSGLAILPEIRSSWPDVKVLILTGRDEDSYIMRALRAGAHGYMLKTAEEQELVQAVQDVVKGRLILGHGVAERVVQGLMAKDTPNEQPLSDLDHAILTGVAAGMTNDQIAERLNIDPQLVAAQLVVIIDQLGASSRVEASLIALRQGLIALEDLHSF